MLPWSIGRSPVHQGIAMIRIIEIPKFARLCGIPSQALWLLVS